MVNRYGVIFEYGMSDFYHNRIIRHIEGTHREQTFPYTLPGNRYNAYASQCTSYDPAS